MHPFQLHSKEAWIEQVKKELPEGLSLEDLSMKSHLYHHDGLAFENDTHARGAICTSEWKITAEIQNEENVTVLKALENGAECLYINIKETTNIDLLLKDVRLDYITTILAFDQCSKSKIISCKEWINDRYTIEDLDLITFGLKDECNTIAYRAGLLNDISECVDLVKSISKVLPNEEENIWIEYTIGKDVYQEISKIRALKMVIDNMKAAYGRDNKVLFFARPLHLESSDFNQVLIALSLQGMSAVWANADYINLYPWHKDHIDQSRLAQNIQQLYKLESSLQSYPDPMAGSALIEQLTIQIADKIWQKLVEE